MTDASRHATFSILLRLTAAVAASCFWSATSYAAAAPTSPALVFNRDVRPILSSNCYQCHGFDSKHRKGGLRLDTGDGAYAKLADGAVAVKPGDLNGSELWRRINSDKADEQMPPAETHKSLTSDDKNVLKRWIEQGAPYQKHWAFELPERPAVPAVAGGNPVDAFILQRLAKEGLAPSPEADRATLLRRVSLDLTGLPASPEEIDAFLKDTSPMAYEKQVDRLLASPHYGERMAVTWLDAARYSDTSGYLHDNLRTPYPWRDWVTAAFNNDMPFNQFVTEQIAGDLLPSPTPQQVLATAFCRNHPITAEGGTIAAEYLNEYAADRVQTFGTVFLGMTFNCCRCHDHKFDAITQDDFYSLESYFNSITEKHLENNTAPAYPPFINIASPLGPSTVKVNVMVMQEAAAPKPTFVLKRGQYDQPDATHPVTRHPPHVLGSAGAFPKNRLGLAEWLMSKQDPLLTRVTVNRLWQKIFGTGLSASVDDFGVQGEYPSHPELLDYLAVEFRDGNPANNIQPWSTKHILRLIVTSATYRQASDMRPDLMAKDPGDRLLGRFPRQRLGAEEIRDQALFAAGLLSPKLGGPATFPYQPAGLWEERSNEGSNTKSYHRSDGESLYRRSLYTFWKRTCPPPLMTVFDAPDRLTCTVRRMPTDTPLQALAIMNDEQMLECAKILAARTLHEPGTNRQRLTQLFRRATGRFPADADLQTLQGELVAMQSRFQSSPADAADLLRQGATPAPADLNQPELAAWMLVASAVLNLDETLVRD